MKSTSSKYGYGDDNKYARQHPPTAVAAMPPTPCPPGHPEKSPAIHKPDPVEPGRR